MQLSELSAEELQEWDDFVETAPAGGVYSRTDYLHLLARYSGADVKVIGLRDGQRFIGGIPLFVRSKGNKRYVASRYLLYYNGPVVAAFEGSAEPTRQKREMQVMSEIEQYLRQANYDSVDVRGRSQVIDCRSFVSQGWRVSPTYSYVINISDPDATIAAMHRNARRQVRQARSAEAVAWTSDRSDWFWTIHKDTCSRHGFAEYLPEADMREFVDELLAKRLGYLVFAGPDESTPQAALLILASRHPTAHMVAAGTIDKCFTQGLSAFVRAEAFKTLSQADYQEVDLTDAHNPSVSSFKNQLGAKLIASYRIVQPVTATETLGICAKLLKNNIKGAIKAIMGRPDSRRASRGGN